MTADPRKAPSPGTGAGFTPSVDAYAAEGPHRAPGAGASSPSEKRRTLRSPRAALEPERVPEPNRPSRRAGHPLVVAGSGVFTIILLVAIGAGFGLALVWAQANVGSARAPVSKTSKSFLSVRIMASDSPLFAKLGQF